MLPPNDIHEYYNTKLPNPKLRSEYNHWKIIQSSSRAIKSMRREKKKKKKSMRTLGPKEIESLGPVSEI